jgi:hypothetical protein
MLSVEKHALTIFIPT